MAQNTRSKYKVQIILNYSKQFIEFRGFLLDAPFLQSDIFKVAFRPRSWLKAQISSDGSSILESSWSTLWLYVLFILWLRWLERIPSNHQILCSKKVFQNIFLEIFFWNEKFTFQKMFSKKFTMENIFRNIKFMFQKLFSGSYFLSEWKHILENIFCKPFNNKHIRHFSHFTSMMGCRFKNGEV